MNIKIKVNNNDYKYFKYFNNECCYIYILRIVLLKVFINYKLSFIFNKELVFVSFINKDLY
jgi:hypothetical protein